jgi:8-oxo-dGTP pyrophosphatase MutT (NUDIX family)
MKKMRTFGIILFSHDNKNVLTVFQVYSKKWSFPKGQDDKPGESNLSCAMRELEEEAGVMKGEYKIIGELCYLTHMFYVARMNRPCAAEDMKTNDPTEISEIAWLPLKDLKMFTNRHPCNSTLAGIKAYLCDIQRMTRDTPVARTYSASPCVNNKPRYIHGSSHGSSHGSISGPTSRSDAVSWRMK